MFCGKNMNGTWIPKYIGKASSFKERLCNHEQWAPSAAQGATHVLAMVVPDNAQRDRLEALLIAELDPPLNVQLRKPIGALALASVQMARYGIPK
jgi:excinuclease UvrABC nuclease subunit